MFQLNEKCVVDGSILKRNFFRYSPAETYTIKSPNSQIYIKKPREDSVISLINSYLDLKFEVIIKK